jgi:hypothetical protein
MSQRKTTRVISLSRGQLEQTLFLLLEDFPALQTLRQQPCGYFCCPHPTQGTYPWAQGGHLQETLHLLGWQYDDAMHVFLSAQAAKAGS